MKRILLFLIAATSWAQTWTTYNGGSLTNPPFPMVWNAIRYDSTNQQTLIWGATDGAGIYADSLWRWKNHVMTQLYTTGNANTSCIPDTATVPENRHTYGQFVIDESRSRGPFWNGACGGPPGPGPGASSFWYIDLPTSQPVKVTPPAHPATCSFSGAAVWDSDGDVYFQFCNGGSSFGGEVYCVGSGSPTAAQLLRGCVNVNDWNQLSVAGGVFPTTFGDAKGMAYDRINKVVCTFGGYAPGPGASGSQTWCYTPATKTWVNRAPATTPPVPCTAAGGIEVVTVDWNPNDGKFYYYTYNCSALRTELYSYEYVANDWTLVCSNCGDAANPLSLAINAATNTIVISNYVSAGNFSIVEGQLTSNNLSITLTIQEALYSGGSAGIARTNEPFCQGVPISLAANLTNTSTLGLTGASAGQFRITLTWDGTRAKWLQVCGIIPSLSAGGTTNVTLTNNGSGNFGGSNLATDGTPIVVSTNGGTCGAGSAICFEIKKANHNGIDRVRIGATTVVASGSSDGLVVIGPSTPGSYPANVTCTPTAGGSACTNEYKSKNDAASTCTLEQNGPVMVAIGCTGAHKDGSANSYMKFTDRYYLYKGKSYVKVDNLLRNADYGTSGTFAAAYKGHRGYEYRLVPNISGTFNYTTSVDPASCTAGVCTGTMTTSNSLIMYEAQTDYAKWQDWCGFGCVTYTPDTGYSLKKDVTTLAGTSSLSNSLIPGGWSDIRDSAGVGVEIGVYQLPGYWPKSLEFNSGTDVRIGIWARENSIPYYQAWPQYSWHTLFLNFHATALASPANDFLKFQQYLVGRAGVADYNNASVFPFTMPSASQEDAYYTATGAEALPAISAGNACCLQDLAVPYATRFYSWAAGGGSNQVEFRWSDLQTFIKRGYTGDYLNSAQFYRMEVEKTFPRADGFTWRSKGSGEVNQTDGFPNAVSANNTLAFYDYVQFEHEHWYGLTDYYGMTGDDTVKDAINDGALNYFLETRSDVNNGAQYNSRSVGSHLMGAARLYQFLIGVGNTTDAASVLSIQDANTWTKNVKNVLCLSGYPSGCSQPTTGGGVSRQRGAHYIQGTDNQCPVGVDGPAVHVFFESILNFGLWEYSRAHGTGWADYTQMRDLAYGVSRFMLSEMYANGNPVTWPTNGFRYNIQLNNANNCPMQGELDPSAMQAVWAPFYILNQTDGGTTWQQQFKFALQQVMSALGMGASDFGQYQIATVINAVNNPGSGTLQTLTLTSFTDNSGGSYTFCWDTPANTSYLRIKYGLLPIVDWIGFNPLTNLFIGNPAATQNWFASPEATGIPTAIPGTQQCKTITGLTTGLLSANFSVKAMTGSITPPPPPQPTCDLNQDGLYNILDVRLMTNQVLGITACTNDLDQSGSCTIVDIQRVIDKALGGVCVIGQ